MEEVDAIVARWKQLGADLRRVVLEDVPPAQWLTSELVATAVDDAIQHWNNGIMRAWNSAFRGSLGLMLLAPAIIPSEPRKLTRVSLDSMGSVRIEFFDETGWTGTGRIEVNCVSVYYGLWVSAG